MILKELICNSFNLWEGVVDACERTDFSQFLLWHGMVVLERTDF